MSARDSAFEKFRIWNSRKVLIRITGPLEVGFGGGEGGSSATVVDLDLHSERITVLKGTPWTGQRYGQFDLSNASFAVKDSPTRLTVQFPDGRMVYFVEISARKIPDSIQETRR